MSRFVVTGANRGIGLELCRQLAQRGDDVVAVCRSAGAALSCLALTVVEGVDVTDADRLEQLSKALAPRSVDVLINNAGILERDSLSTLDADALRRQFETNAVAPLLVTRALLDRLATDARVGIVTSRMGSIGDNTSGGYYGYRMSKAAVNMVGAGLAVDLRDRGIAVALLHPGMVATDMTGAVGIPVEEAAAGLIQRLDELDLSQSGSFWHANGERLPW